MANSGEPVAAKSDAEFSLTLTRIFDASREAVFRTWIDPQQIARWLGPRSVKAEVAHMDARPGGSYRIVMHGESGSINIVSGIYREVASPERLVFTWAWEEDAATHRSGYETVVTVTFRAIGRKTEMTLRQDQFAAKESRDSHKQGWSGSFDKLAEVLAGKPGRA